MLRQTQCDHLFSISVHTFMYKNKVLSFVQNEKKNLYKCIYDVNVNGDLSNKIGSMNIYIIYGEMFSRFNCLTESKHTA